MRAIRTFAAAAALLLACACSDKAATEPPTTPIPLVTWVTELAGQTTDDSLPDTVEDKVIEDTEDQAAFDTFLVEN